MWCNFHFFCKELLPQLTWIFSSIMGFSVNVEGTSCEAEKDSQQRDMSAGEMSVLGRRSLLVFRKHCVFVGRALV